MLALLGTIGGFVGLNPVSKIAKLVGGGFALVLLVGLLFGLKTCVFSAHDQARDAKREAATAKADRKADEKAAVERRSDDNRLSNETQALQETEKAHATDSPSARRVARQRCIRLQQQARAAGHEPPACN